MHVPTEFSAFRAAVADAVATGDAAAVRATIHPVGRTLAAEHGSEFRDLIAGLPIEIWHNDPQIAAQMGGSYRSSGSPRGMAALGYFRAAEGALAVTPEAPRHCLASVLLGHASALRSLGQFVEARAKTLAAQKIIESELSDVPVIRIELGARFSLENGMLDLHLGHFLSARNHLEYAHGLSRTHLSRAEHVELIASLAYLDAVNGILDRALEGAGYARELAEGTDLMQTGYGAPALLAEIIVYNERTEVAASEAAMAAMLEATSRNEWEPCGYAAQAHHLALSGRFIESLDTVEQSLKAYTGWDGPGFGSDFALLLRAALLLGLDHADEAWAILKDLPPHENHILCPARIVAQLRMAHGDLLGADEAIRDCEALGALHCARTVADVQLLRAAIESARGNAVSSAVAADRAFVTITRTGARGSLARIGGSQLATLVRAGLTRTQTPEVHALLTQLASHAGESEPAIEPLSARERLVLAQVQRGLTVAAIAAELYISPNTVKTHLRRLYRKLGVNTREEAIRAARSLGLDREITRDSPSSSPDSVAPAVL